MSISQSVHLQVLRRLSEETGGAFIQAGQDFSLPDDFLQSPFQAFDSGGQITFDLTPALQASLNGSQSVQLTWQTETSPITMDVAVTLTNQPLTTPSEKLLPKLLYLVPIIIILLIIIWLKRNNSTETKTIYAYLEFVNSEPDNYSIITDATRIGRHKDNELQINNTSVSSYHAEIHRRRDNSFVLTDLNSLNKVSNSRL